MSNFPFSTFLALLSADGIHLSIHDYERMQRAFAAGGVWTIVRLKNVLTALLAKDKDQERLIGRKFDLHFSAETEKDKLPPEIDVRKLIRDLRSMPSTSQPPQEPDPSGVKTSNVVPKDKPPSPREFRSPIRTVASRCWRLPCCLPFWRLLYFFPGDILQSTETSRKLRPWKSSIFIKGAGRSKFETGKRVYPNVPFAQIKLFSLERDDSWKTSAGLCGLIFLSLLIAAAYLWRWQRPIKDRQPNVDDEKPDLFDHPAPSETIRSRGWTAGL